MYLVSVVLLLAILPAVILQAAFSPHGMSITGLLGKWYVFWAGIWLLLAGLRQVSQPRFTAAEIFDFDNVKAFPIVREIGFANLAMGTLGVSTILRPAWLVPAAIVGGLYYGLAGLGHLLRDERNVNETLAMVSDGFAFLVLLPVVVKGWLQAAGGNRSRICKASFEMRGSKADRPNTFRTPIKKQTSGRIELRKGTSGIWQT
jgi:hypothetical protein